MIRKTFLHLALAVGLASSAFASETPSIHTVLDQYEAIRAVLVMDAVDETADHARPSSRTSPISTAGSTPRLLPSSLPPRTRHSPSSATCRLPLPLWLRRPEQATLPPPATPSTSCRSPWCVIAS